MARMMPGRIARVSARPLRAAQLAEQERADYPPIGRQNLTKGEARTAMSPLVGLAASGQIPMTEEVAQAVAHVLGAEHRRLQRLNASTPAANGNAENVVE